MKIQTTLALALLATTLNAYSSQALDNATDTSSEESLQSQTATSVDTNTDAMEVDNFGPGHGGGGGFHPAPGGGFHPAPGGGFHPAPGGGGFHPAPAPMPHPGPVGPGPGGFHPPGPIGPGPHPGPFPGPGHAYNPYPVHGGVYPWPHWGHPVFERPVFPFEWARLRVVTCTAENSSGYQFPVTEDGFVGFAYQGRMEQVEDAAIDRCYNETNGDQSCVLLGCTPGY
jgi:hypothetical protein